MSRRALVGVACLAAACGTGAPPAVPVPVPDSAAVVSDTAAAVVSAPVPSPIRGAVAEGARGVLVFYGTDRQLTGRTPPAELYGAEPGPLRYGLLRVTVPLDRDVRPTGSLPALPALGPFKLTPDPARHVILERVAPLGAEAWGRQLTQAAADSAPVLLYVHGFANSFEDAARRAAQVAADLPWPGPMLVYSWPSRGDATPLGYFRDDKSLNGSQALLREFLEAVMQRVPPARLHVLAHSMGTLLTARTLAELAGARPERRINELVLAAPDIDTTAFMRSFAGPLTAVARRVTIYASRHDAALDLAERASSFPRVGQAGAALFVAPGIDVIDASVARGSAFGHGYYGENAAVLNDLKQLLDGRAPSARRLEPRTKGALRYWVLLGGS